MYDLLAVTAVDIAAPGVDDITGFGRVDALAAVTAVDVPGDANRDLVTNFVDLGILAFNWIQCGRTWEQGNFTTPDTCVDYNDFAILAENYE